MSKEIPVPNFKPAQKPNPDLKELNRLIQARKERLAQKQREKQELKEYQKRVEQSLNFED